MNVRKIYLPHRLCLLNGNPENLRHLLPVVQSKLKKRGFYQGAIHNLYDSSTREAIVKYQQSEGLKPTGVLDQLTYCRLYDADIAEIEAIEKKERISYAMPRAHILITKGSRQLTLLDGQKAFRQYPIAIGKPATPTPEGNYSIATKILNPGGILGTRWMGLNYDTYGIHGTSKPWLIGQMVSNGCIRMHNNHAEELFMFINIGTPVHIRQ